MNENKEIHLLAQELIPVINDLDDEPKQIILDHMKDCDDCRNLHMKALEFDNKMPTFDYPEISKPSPLKKLVQFNTGLKLLLIAVRGIILSFILYSGFNSPSTNQIDFLFMKSAIYLFYTPAAIFLLVFTFTFFNKRWLWISLFADLFIIFFLNKILHLIF